MIWVGCCGFRKARATYYRHFSVVEVQRTFYKPPRVETARRWREEAPPEFIFTVKAWQLITHPATSPTYRKAGLEIPTERRHLYGGFRWTAEVREAWERTREIARALQAPVVLFQCPARFTPTSEHIAAMRAFFEQVERGGLTFAWEPRGEWPQDLVAALCRELDLIHCVDPFVHLPVTEEIAYFRLHGIGGYRYRYSDADLRQVLAWSRRFGTAYVLFNNVSMWEDALRFQALVCGAA